MLDWLNFILFVLLMLLKAFVHTMFRFNPLQQSIFESSVVPLNCYSTQQANMSTYSHYSLGFQQGLGSSGLYSFSSLLVCLFFQEWFYVRTIIQQYTVQYVVGGPCFPVSLHQTLFVIVVTIFSNPPKSQDHYMCCMSMHMQMCMLHHTCFYQDGGQLFECWHTYWAFIFITMDAMNAAFLLLGKRMEPLIDRNKHHMFLAYDSYRGTKIIDLFKSWFQHYNNNACTSFTSPLHYTSYMLFEYTLNKQKFWIQQKCPCLRATLTSTSLPFLKHCCDQLSIIINQWDTN